MTYNLRHGRHGHLFQNRYKSIVCDADSYFMGLVRYIHLNPLRVGLAKDLLELERYPYCGRGVITGRLEAPWQDQDYVLSWFGLREGEAREAYRGFVKEGIALGEAFGTRGRWVNPVFGRLVGGVVVTKTRSTAAN